MNRKWIFALFMLLFGSTAFAIDLDTEIAKASQTPLARNPKTKFYSFPFVNDVNFRYNAHTQNVLDFKPIFSFQATQSYDLIIRTIAPLLYHQPTSTTSHGYTNGWGDLNPTTFISPVSYHTTLWGVGPTFFIPTATNKALGSGKWSIGPEIALFTLSDPWTLGMLTSNVWSVAGDPSRAAVNQFSFQYFISYNLSKGWYITSQPTITANWEASSNKVWTVPFGLGAGKGFNFKNGGIVISLQSYYNVFHPTHLGPNWTVQAKLEFDLVDRKVVAL